MVNEVAIAGCQGIAAMGWVCLGCTQRRFCKTVVYILGTVFYIQARVFKNLVNVTNR
ncbi:hypothetical protein [Alkalinema sp. FACHB-956]|uniref:hypothetical protein n=1 Tax=Alkalinema sp. FACHB-956 TaxID=2692768 RepID=UPI0016852F31|nr:hypothetical protein [Alkalinema sp. FACHB-956]MBD2330027.1 hypothetical protein [Alkalinema sp. FACHB-956]